MGNIWNEHFEFERRENWKDIFQKAWGRDSYPIADACKIADFFLTEFDKRFASQKEKPEKETK